MVNSTWHTISVSYANGKWRLYDPNFDHSKLPLYKAFKTRKSLVNAILKSQASQSLVIEYASLDDNKKLPLATFDKCIKQSPSHLLKESGFHLLTAYLPEKLPTILSNVMEEKDGALVIANAIATFDDEGCTGFNKMIWCAPSLLPNVLKYAKAAPNGYEYIGYAVASPNYLGETGLLNVMQCAPDQLMTLLNIIEKMPKGAEYLAQSLIPHQDKSAWKTLSTMKKDVQAKIDNMLTTGWNKIHADTLKLLKIEIRKHPLVAAQQKNENKLFSKTYKSALIGEKAGKKEWKTIKFKN